MSKCFHIENGGKLRFPKEFWIILVTSHFREVFSKNTKPQKELRFLTYESITF